MTVQKMSKNMRVICMAIIGVCLASTAEAATQCRESKPQDATGYWQWRQIDGRRCWYEGRQKVSKTALVWAKQQQDQARQAKPQQAKPQQAKPQQAKAEQAEVESVRAPQAKPPQSKPQQARVEPVKAEQGAQQRQPQDKRHQEEVDRLLHSYWPPLPR